ncbi:MAG: hypothetical protein J5929_07240 [Eubacterium sp.]|nr:hypothetical protein [Eubacterium sp.]
MDLFENLNEKIDDKLNELNALSQKYVDYKPVMPSQVKYRAIQNDAEKQLVSGIVNGTTWLIAIVGLAFLVTGIFAIFTGKMVLGIIIALMGVGIGIFGLITAMSKVEVAFGRAVWKHFKYQRFPVESSKMFFASIIIDEPEKIIVRDVQTTREDFDRIVEGTPMILIKKGGVYHTKVY